MEGFDNKLRAAMYIIRCPMSVIAKDAGVAGSTVHYAMNGRGKIRLKTAQAIATVVLREMSIQKSELIRQIEEIDKASKELREAFENTLEGDKR